MPCAGQSWAAQWLSRVLLSFPHQLADKRGIWDQTQQMLRCQIPDNFYKELRNDQFHQAQFVIFLYVYDLQHFLNVGNTLSQCTGLDLLFIVINELGIISTSFCLLLTDLISIYTERFHVQHTLTHSIWRYRQHLKCISIYIMHAQLQKHKHVYESFILYLHHKYICTDTFYKYINCFEPITTLNITFSRI